MKALMKIGQRIAACLAGAAALVLAVAGGLNLAGARWNTTASVPEGLYWTIKAPIKTGAYVLVCPTDTRIDQMARERTYIGTGPCPGNYERMIKRIGGMTGDAIAVRADGVYVNNRKIADSAPMAHDPAGRPLPVIAGASFALGSHQVLLMGENQLSFDSRYYGAVGEDAVVSVLKPIWTWKGE